MKINKYVKEQVEFIEIEFTSSFFVCLANLGASIYKVELYGKDMVVYPLHVNDFKKETVYFGKTIGRSANRIKNSLALINNRIYHLANNENTTTLHGGYFGLSTQYFKSQIKEIDQDNVCITYSYLSHDLESGFPGNLHLDVIYNISSIGEIKITYSAICDKDTLLNLTNHCYFNLGENDNKNLILKCRNDKYIDVDNDLIPKQYCPVNKFFDFNDGLSIDKYIDEDALIKNGIRGYDNHICFSKQNKDYYEIELSSPHYILQVITNFNGFQLYSDNKIDDIVTNSKSKIRRGVTLECQDDLLESHLWPKNKIYEKYITYKFMYKDRK